MKLRRSRRVDSARRRSYSSSSSIIVRNLLLSLYAFCRRGGRRDGSLATASHAASPLSTGRRAVTPLSPVTKGFTHSSFHRSSREQAAARTTSCDNDSAHHAGRDFPPAAASLDRVDEQQRRRRRWVTESSREQQQRGWAAPAKGNPTQADGCGVRADQSAPCCACWQWVRPAAARGASSSSSGVQQ